MKFTVCGSGDAIGVPGVFCRCANCMSARRNGGREKRSRTGFLLGNTIKFDFGPDTPMQAREQLPCIWNSDSEPIAALRRNGQDRAGRGHGDRYKAHSN